MALPAEFTYESGFAFLSSHIPALPKGETLIGGLPGGKG
jgi:hypothetical protein|tara:strand:- start:335 stop:451 length:117 start_codon:yes stop_codon:yes gene_type:complete